MLNPLTGPKIKSENFCAQFNLRINNAKTSIKIPAVLAGIWKDRFFRFHLADRFDLYVQDTFLKEKVVFDSYLVPGNFSVQIFASLSD